MANDVPTEYLCRVVELDQFGREDPGYRDEYIAKTLDDAAAWLDGQDEGAESRRFKYEIREIEVVG